MLVKQTAKHPQLSIFPSDRPLTHSTVTAWTPHRAASAARSRKRPAPVFTVKSPRWTVWSACTRKWVWEPAGAHSGTPGAASRSLIRGVTLYYKSRKIGGKKNTKSGNDLICLRLCRVYCKHRRIRFCKMQQPGERRGARCPAFWSNGRVCTALRCSRGGEGGLSFGTLVMTTL